MHFNIFANIDNSLLTPSADVDYTPINTTISFNESITVIRTGIPLIDDDYVEGDETLLANIDIITQGNIFLFTPQQAPVTILDDDSKQCSSG